jgi:hypothetical protein
MSKTPKKKKKKAHQIQDEEKEELITSEPLLHVKKIGKSQTISYVPLQ